jgi:hypothetical protein
MSSIVSVAETSVSNWYSTEDDLAVGDPLMSLRHFLSCWVCGNVRNRMQGIERAVTIWMTATSANLARRHLLLNGLGGIRLAKMGRVLSVPEASNGEQIHYYFIV